MFAPRHFAQFLYMAAAQPDALQKATAADLATVTPESLGPVSHLATWDADQPFFGTTVKLLPVVSARQLEHSETATIAHATGSGRLGWTPETGAAPSRTRNSVKLSGWLKGLAELSKVTSHAGYTALIPDARQNVTAQQQEDYSALQRLADNRANLLLHYDTRWESSGSDEENLLGSAGLFQQIEQNSGTGNVSGRGGTNLIDLRGAVLTLDRLRYELTHLHNLNGVMPNVVTLPSHAHNSLSAEIMPQIRGDFGTTGIAYGTMVVAVTINGIPVPVLPDLHLSWERSWPLYQEPDADLSPPAAPSSVSATAGAVSSGETSYWDAASDGNVFYVVVPVSRLGVYGYGLRNPVSTTAYTAVTAGQKVTLTITPASGNELAFAVFRGHEDTGGAKTDAALIGYVPANGGAAVTFTDLNTRQPRTDRALALPLGGPVVGSMLQLLQAGGIQNFTRSVAANLAAYSEDAQIAMGGMISRGVCRAVLGPTTMRIRQGVVGWTQQSDMLGQITRAYAPGARNCIAFDNIGRA